MGLVGVKVMEWVAMGLETGQARPFLHLILPEVCLLNGYLSII